MLKGFISYSHKDTTLCAELMESLVSFEREGRASFWSDHAIDAGEQWYPAIMDQLEEADIAILLLSREFYASEFVWREELPRVRERWEDGKLVVVSIRLRACFDSKAEVYKWLREVQQVPRGGRFVDHDSRNKRDKAWVEVAKEIDRTIDKVLQQREVGISRSNEVDAAIADAAQAVARAQETARQINVEVIGAIPKNEIAQALNLAQASLGADTQALRDEVASAYHRLRRLKFERDENSQLHDALSQVRDHLMDLSETARDASYPGRKDVGLSPPELVPREQLADQMAEVGRQLDGLQSRVEKLEAQKQNTSDTAAADAAIDRIVEDVGQQSALARGLMSEPLVDIAGVEAAINGTARVAFRFVRRITDAATATMRALVTSVAAAAKALKKAGEALMRAALSSGDVEMKISSLATNQIRFTGGSKFLLTLSKAEITAFLTKARLNTNGTMTGYFYFKNGELVAADYVAYEDDGVRLRRGFSVVESPAVLSVCEALEDALPQIASAGGIPVNFRLLILSFAKAVVTMTLAGGRQPLVGLSYPKSVYRYGSAYNAKMKLLELINEGVVPAFSQSDIAELRKRNPFAAGPSFAERDEDYFAPENLLRVSPSELNELFRQDQFQNEQQGFVLLEQGAKGSNGRLLAASEALVDASRAHNSNPRYLKWPIGWLAVGESRALRTALVSARSMLQDAHEVTRITGRLRTFWITFENMVIGVCPFSANPGPEQYFLVSTYAAPRDGELSFNYRDAEASIRLLCAMAAEL